MEKIKDTIYRQDALEDVKSWVAIDGREKQLQKDVIEWLKEFPPAQPEPSIPLPWIEKHIEWLKSLNNELANLAVIYISVMVEKWEGEQDEGYHIQTGCDWCI